MTVPYEYFVTMTVGYQQERPANLWRKQGEEWEFLSLIDWQWRNVKDTNAKYPPMPEKLRAVSAERAREMEADRKSWVIHWAHYADEADWRDGEKPTTVVRRRHSPENRYDEVFRRANTWGPTTAVYEFTHSRASNPPHLVEISANEAERILQELRGISGATDL
ncbi:hypothetical protein ACFYYR_11255 [Streptomyces sp. NPDC001922]|uniref:hypothetical protein n=1 Tax=Streptomyces sp. NPDC001922 TaxID=3364624 RepID=UPI00367DB16B